MATNPSVRFNFIVSTAIFIICYVFLALYSVRPPSSFDSFWHLKMGIDWLEKGLSPWIDHYSFTFYGKNISAVPVIFQITFAKYVSLFGEQRGFYLFKLSYVTLLMLSIYFFFKQIKTSWFVVILIVPLLTFFINIRLFVRPDILSNILIVICLALYLKTQKHFATKELTLICLLLIFWTNYHSPVFGYIIIFGLFLDKFVKKLFFNDKSFYWNQWLAWGLGIFLIGFARPGGEHFLFTDLSVLSNEFANYTKEYFHSYDIYSTNIVVHLLWILSVYVVIWSLLKREFGFAFISALLAYFSWSTQRLVTPAAIVNLCILAYYLSQLNKEIFTVLSPTIKYGIVSISTIICALTFFYLFKDLKKTHDIGRHESQFMNERFPVKAVDYLHKFQNGGNILNRVKNGGYIIYKLAPEYKVYIDGRTNILYPIDFLKHWINVYSNPTALKYEIDNGDIHYAIYETSKESLMLFKNIDKLQLNYVDANYMLFSVKTGISFPLTSKLLILPMCWRDELSTYALQEIELAREHDVDSSFDLVVAHEFLYNYITSENRFNFLNQSSLRNSHLDIVSRLAAYLSLMNKNQTSAINHFNSIKKKEDWDILMAANALTKKSDFTNAEKLLFLLYSIHNYRNVEKLSFDKLFIFTRTLESIQKNQTKYFFTEEVLELYINQLVGIHKDAKDPDTAIRPFSDVCESFFPQGFSNTHTHF